MLLIRAPFGREAIGLQEFAVVEEALVVIQADIAGHVEARTLGHAQAQRIEDRHNLKQQDQRQGRSDKQ